MKLWNSDWEIDPEEKTELEELLRRHTVFRPLVPPEWLGRPARFDQLRVIFFDIYGTLFLGMRQQPLLEDPRAAQAALEEVFRSAGLQLLKPLDGTLDRLNELIGKAQSVRREQGFSCPEVDIVEVWGQLLEDLFAQEVVAPTELSGRLLRRLTLHWEAVRNPVWPAPGLPEAFSLLRSRGYQLGLISNSQFYCRLLFSTYFGKELEELGFDPQLVFLSYEYGWAKPGTRLFELAAEALHSRGVLPAQAVHVGNDLKQDIAPARAVGFHTVLLAQDRWNLGKPTPSGSTESVRPDAVAGSVAELVSFLG
jgi:putative hydrolase of the HAD superfamily